MGDRAAAIEPAEEIETLIGFLKRNARLDTASPTALYRRVQDALRERPAIRLFAHGSAPWHPDTGCNLVLAA